MHEHRHVSCDTIRQHLPDEVFVSETTINGEPWLRSVSANPFAQPALVVEGFPRSRELGHVIIRRCSTEPLATALLDGQ